MARVLRISIDQQRAEIGISSTPAQMRITQPRRNMRLKNDIPQMDLKSEMPTFKVNRRKINSESGLKPPMELAKQFRDEGSADALKGARRAKEDGNFLGDVTNPGERVGRLARMRTMSAIMDKQQINIGLMPQSTAEITWDKGQTNVEWSGHMLTIDWEGDFMPQVTVEPPHSVEVYLRTKPYFRIRVEEGAAPIVSGKRVDQAV